jgi:FkbM family methyltransferase
LNTQTLTSNDLHRAQFGEDRVLWRVFREKRDGFFIEIGAYDGVHLSNTFFLEQMGWHGILVEPIYQLCERAAAARSRSRVVHAACSRKDAPPTAAFTIAKNVPLLSFLCADDEHRERCVREGAELIEIEVPVVTVDRILRYERKADSAYGNAWVPKRGWQIDLVSIDTEGCELDVLDGFDLDRFKPSVLVIENDRPSGSAIEPYLSERGYRKFHRQVINDFFVRDDMPEGELNLDRLETPEP